MILKTCLKAGHRWGRGHRASGWNRIDPTHAHEWWVEIRQCQRKLCDRYRYADDTGRVFTYDLVDGRSVRTQTIVRPGPYS